MSVVLAPQVAFLILLVLGGHVGMPLILSATFFSGHVFRHPVFVNFCITWMLYSLAYTLLLYAGQITNPQPKFNLCMTQSAMIYGSPPMIGASVFVFVLHLYLLVRERVGYAPLRWPNLRLAIMLAAPYVVFLSVFTVAITMANSQPLRVHRSSFYCDIEIPEITHICAEISGVAMVLSLVIEILTGIKLYWHWRAFRATNAKTGLNISILVRTLGLLICSVFALVTCLAFLTNLTSMVSYFVLASLPLTAFLVFGTHSDLLRVWCFWWRSDGRHAQDAKASAESGVCV
ncbi:hypothetical protein JB92DRAFT_3052414 [Gautieria morchelliformis]|nr:hypothetical protein JB92DRAFT_3052414 [Gautieria morchelliformis]